MLSLNKGLATAHNIYVKGKVIGNYSIPPISLQLVDIDIQPAVTKCLLCLTFALIVSCITSTDRRNNVNAPFSLHLNAYNEIAI